MSRIGLGLTSAVLALALSGCAGLVAGAGGESPSGQPAQEGKAAKVEKPTPTPTPHPTDPPIQLEDLLGSDGRLSVLILGSDWREGIVGERTDAIIVASIDPVSGKVAMASLPRDTVNVPIGPNRVYAGRINNLYWDFQRSSGKKRVALKKTRKALEYAFDTEIDYYALFDFKGLVRLVNSIGGIEVTLDEPLIDPTMRLGKRGLRLKAGARKLDGKTALAFTRSRYSDSDYARSGRQQQVISAAAQKVRERGASSLPALVELATKKITTDIPLAAAPILLDLAIRAKLTSPKSRILAPGRWARPGPSQYTISPRIKEVRKMFDRVFRPLR
ncbi:MAG: LCP family protein [Chloroflexota bacterium]